MPAETDVRSNLLRHVMEWKYHWSSMLAEAICIIQNKYFFFFFSFLHWLSMHLHCLHLTMWCSSSTSSRKPFLLQLDFLLLSFKPISINLIRILYFHDKTLDSCPFSYSWRICVRMTIAYFCRRCSVPFLFVCRSASSWADQPGWAAVLPGSPRPAQQQQWWPAVSVREQLTTFRLSQQSPSSPASASLL